MTLPETAVMSFEQIAAQMGMSRPAVIRLHDSAMEKLARILEDRRAVDRPHGNRGEQ